jgi:hypothetical protein
MRGFVLALSFLVSSAGLVQAGPNAGGVIGVHYNASVAYTSDPECSTAGVVPPLVHDAPEDLPVRWFAYALFPPGSSPVLKTLAFGVSYHPAEVILDWAANAADYELPMAGWPAPDTGTLIEWSEARTEQLVQVYCFAGTGYGCTHFKVVPHPEYGGWFYDDTVPPLGDPIEGYEALGFGCATRADIHSWGSIKATYRDETR